MALAQPWSCTNACSLQVDVRKIDNTAVLAKQLERLQASTANREQL